MTKLLSDEEFAAGVKEEIRYRVEQEYEKYHNDMTFKWNGKDFWIEQIVNKLSETLDSSFITQKRLYADSETEPLLEERDRLEDNIDSLANAVGRYFNAELGEHSSINNPWLNALALLEHETKLKDRQ